MVFKWLEKKEKIHVKDYVDNILFIVLELQNDGVCVCIKSELSYKDVMADSNKIGGDT
jgi:hypothetical protein